MVQLPAYTNPNRPRLNATQALSQLSYTPKIVR